MQSAISLLPIHYSLLLFTTVVHCAMPYLDDAPLITIVLIKTGENTGWFTTKHQGSRNPEWNQFKNQRLIGGNGYECLALNVASGLFGSCSDLDAVIVSLVLVGQVNILLTNEDNSPFKTPSVIFLVFGLF